MQNYDPLRSSSAKSLSMLHLWNGAEADDKTAIRHAHQNPEAYGCPENTRYMQRDRYCLRTYEHRSDAYSRTLQEHRENLSIKLPEII